jgi:hypothetical protein
MSAIVNGQASKATVSAISRVSVALRCQAVKEPEQTAAGVLRSWPKRAKTQRQGTRSQIEVWSGQLHGTSRQDGLRGLTPDDANAAQRDHGKPSPWARQACSCGQPTRHRSFGSGDARPSASAQGTGFMTLVAGVLAVCSACAPTQRHSASYESMHLAGMWVTPRLQLGRNSSSLHLLLDGSSTETMPPKVDAHIVLRYTDGSAVCADARPVGEFNDGLGSLAPARTTSRGAGSYEDDRPVGRRAESSRPLMHGGLPCDRFLSQGSAVQSAYQRRLVARLPRASSVPFAVEVELNGQTALAREVPHHLTAGFELSDPGTDLEALAP